MPRTARASAGGYCFHVLNRGNARAEVFHHPGDYDAFLNMLAEASVRLPMRLLAYCLSPTTSISSSDPMSTATQPLDALAPDDPCPPLSQVLPLHRPLPAAEGNLGTGFVSGFSLTTTPLHVIYRHDPPVEIEADRIKRPWEWDPGSPRRTSSEPLRPGGR
jgi:hypothetical protein